MVKTENELGTISISNDVFTYIAGDAATNCFGVKGMAGRSKDSNFVQLLRRDSMSKGVFVSFGNNNDISIELHIVVDHGVNLVALGESIIGEVSYKVSNATGVPVTSVDIYVDSMVLD